MRLGRAWTGLTPGLLAFLALILFADDREWSLWVSGAEEYLDFMQRDFRTSSLGRRRDWEEDIIAILDEGSRYGLDLPDTPSAWRSYSTLREEHEPRIAEIDRLAKRMRERVGVAAQEAIDLQLARDVELQRVKGEAFKRHGLRAELTRRGTASHGKRVARLHQQRVLDAEKSSQPQTDLLSAVRELNVIELGEFVKKFQETFDVRVDAPPADSPAVGDQGVHAGVSAFDVILERVGDKKIQVIKEVRALTSLGLGEAKRLVDEAPNTVIFAVDGRLADEARAALEQAGATVELRSINED